MVGKLCAETHLKWPDILPIALFYLCTKPRVDLHISSYEMLFGHAPLQAKTYKEIYISLLGNDCQIALYLSVLQQRMRELQNVGVLIQSDPLDYSLLVENYEGNNPMDQIELILLYHVILLAFVVMHLNMRQFGNLLLREMHK